MSNDVEAVKSKIDIVDFISKYVNLKKAGINYSGLCPFHQEKTPSFMVNPERQSYKCFGCNESGDVIDFHMKIEGLEFAESLKMLAEQVGVKLTPLSKGSSSSYSNNINKTRLYELNAYLTKAWHQILLKHPSAEKARNYLKSRHLTQETIVNWQIGFAPPDTITFKLLKDKNFTSLEHQQAGKPGRLAGRIIFPIRDLVGKTVGFTGRLLDDSIKNVPKYWNTPETAIFHKGQIIYGLDLAKNSIREQDLALLVEGQMDVITLHQAGFKIAVATSGTSLTPDHLKIIKRFTSNLAVAFDTDQAGLEATKRVLEIAFAQDLIPEIITTLSGKDPAEAIINDPQAWQDSFTNRQNFLEWLLKRSIDQYGQSTGAAKKKVVKQLLPWLKRITNPVERSFWVKIIAEKLNISETSILESLTLEANQNKESNLINDSTVSQLKPSSSNEMLLIGLLSRFPLLIKEIKTEKNDLGQFQSLVDRLGQWDRKSNFSQFLSKLESKWQKVISEAHISSVENYPQLTYEQAQEETYLILKKIEKDKLELIKSKFIQQIAEAERSGDITRVKKLIKELQNAMINR